MKKKKGFTLVEVLIASAVLSLFTVAGYKVFIGLSRSFQKGSWSLATQNKLRNGLTFIREEMQKASYKTEVTVSGTNIFDGAPEFLLNESGLIDSDAVIAKWKICLPEIQNDPDSPGAVVQCELKLAGGELLYSKSVIEGSDPTNKERALSNYRVVTNVSEIEVSKELFDPDDPRKGSLIVLNITIEHPDKANFPNAHVIDRTGAKVEVEVGAL